MAEAEALSRYIRQSRFGPIGESGQAHIAAAKVLICGCGALGSVIAERLARAGVGTLRLVDRDWVELSNLQRQTLFTEADAAEAQPKAVAAASALAKINSSIAVEALVEDVSYQNIEALGAGCDLILDGTDNFETRFLINDYCVKQGVPWVHGGCLGASGQVLSILPGTTACFRCLVPELPPREAVETCDSAGVLGSAIGLIACWQVAEALKILSGNRAAIRGDLIVLDSWNTECRVVALQRRQDCEACGLGRFPFLLGEIRSETTILCGKNAVQLESPQVQTQSLDALAVRLQALGVVTHNAFFVRLSLPEHKLTVFRGGRTIIEGTTNVAEAKSMVARILGS